MDRRVRSVKELVDILASMVPREEKKKYEVSIFNRKLSMKNQFFAWCKINRRIARYSEEKTREVFMRILEENRAKNRRFDLSMLREVTDDWFDLMYGLGKRKSED